MRVLIFVLFSLLLLSTALTSARRHRRSNKIKMVNSSERNLKLHCQSNLTDLRDQFIYEGEKFEFSFYDFDPENKHFWCDAYGLNNFFESFDIFGKTAPSDDVMIWYLQPDGLYYNDTNESGYRQSWWTWSDTAL